jgi:hypothetical protein
MRCENHGCTDPGREIYLVPGAGTVLMRFLCLPCCRQLGLYCDKHDLSHVRFEDGSHACIPCIEDDVQANSQCAQDHYNALASYLPLDEWTKLDDWADTVGGIMGDPGKEVTILRALLTRAHRTGADLDMIVTEAIKSRSVSDLLPPLI